MRRTQKILLCFILLYFLLFLKSYASIEQSKVVKLEDAKCQIDYVEENTYIQDDFSISSDEKNISDYEYYVVLTNGSTKQPKLIYDSASGIYTSDFGLIRSLLFQSNDYYKVPSGKGKAFDVEGVLEQNGDIRAWIYVVDSGEIQLVKGNIPVSRPTFPKIYDRFMDGSFYSKTGISITLNAPRDVWVKRNFKIKIGEVNDYNILSKLKDNYNTNSNLLYQFAKEDKSFILETDLETPLYTEVTYNGCYYSEMPIPNKLDIGNNITIGDYYYIFIEYDDENKKYIPIDSVSIFQAGNTYTDIWTLYKIGATQFNWDNIDKYENLPADTIDDNTTDDLNNINEVDNQVNNITNNNVNNIVENKANSVDRIDNTLAEDELPYTGLELRVLYILFILLCVIYYRYKKIKFRKKV